MPRYTFFTLKLHNQVQWWKFVSKSAWVCDNQSHHKHISMTKRIIIGKIMPSLIAIIMAIGRNNNLEIHTLSVLVYSFLGLRTDSLCDPLLTPYIMRLQTVRSWCRFWCPPVLCEFSLGPVSSYRLKTCTLGGLETQLLHVSWWLSTVYSFQNQSQHLPD